MFKFFLLIFLPIFLSISSTLSFPVFAQSSQVWCAIRYLSTSGDGQIKSIAISLGGVSSSSGLCASASSVYLSSIDGNNLLISVSQSTIFGDPSSYYLENTYQRSLTSSEVDLYYCYLDDFSASENSFSFFYKGLEFLISFLPESPQSIRIPTIINSAFSQGSLAAALILELYSAIWQLLLIAAIIKLYKLIPFKAT